MGMLWGGGKQRERGSYSPTPICPIVGGHKEWGELFRRNFEGKGLPVDMRDYMEGGMGKGGVWVEVG